MAFVDYQAQIIQCKVIWYGPSGSGKTASLDHIFERTKSPEATKRPTEPHDPNTAYYDYLPLMLGEIRGFKTKFHLFTVPGAIGHDGARHKLLESADGIVFTADSRPNRQRENAMFMQELRQLLAHWQLNLAVLPLVIQCTFADAKDALPPTQVASPLLAGFIEPANVPTIASIPPQGTGVFDATKAIAKLILTELKKG